VIFFVLNAIIRKKISQQLSRISSSLEIRYSGIHANILSSSVSFDSLDINFIPYGNDTQHKHHLSFAKFSLRGIRFFKFIFNKELFANDIITENTSIQLDSFLLATKDSLQPEIMQKIKWPVERIFIRNISLRKIKLSSHNGQVDRPAGNGDISLGEVSIDKPGDSPSIGSIDVHLSEIDYSRGGYSVQMPRLIINSTKKIAEADSLQIVSPDATASVAALKITGFDLKKSLKHQTLVAKNIETNEIKVTDDNYRVEIKNSELSSENSFARINNISISPSLDKYELGQKMRHQADWMRASIPTIEIAKPDVEKLFQRELNAESIKVNDARVYVFRDRRLPRQKKIIPLPMEYLRDLPMKVYVHSCKLANATIEYEEYPKNGYGKTGMLRIEKFNASVSTLTNHSSFSESASIIMTVDGSIMGTGTSHCTIEMPLQKGKPYKLDGIMEKLDLTKLNSSSENLGKIHIKSGFLDFLSFNFLMTEERSTGKIIGAYHHLIIQPYKKHEEEKNVADFASFMLRHFIIRLDKDVSMPVEKRTGLVNYKRDPTRMVSYYFLQSLLMGIKKSFTLGFLLPK
jgi:hypothetical protein